MSTPTDPHDLIFTEFPTVIFGSCAFMNVPVILQYEDTPLIEVVQIVDVGYTISYRIWAPDGTYLAKVVGSRVFPTPEGSAAGIRTEHPNLATVCKIGENGVIFEVRRESAAALKTYAQLYTPNGRFIRCSEFMEYMTASDEGLKVISDTKNVASLKNAAFDGTPIAFHLKEDGSMIIGGMIRL